MNEPTPLRASVSAPLLPAAPAPFGTRRFPTAKGLVHRLKAASALAALALATTPAHAQNPPLRMEVITAYNFVVDSNIESPSTNGPAAAHLGVKVTNTSATPLTNVVVKIGDLTKDGSGNFTSELAGQFEQRTVPQATGYTYWTQGAEYFALTMPGGAEDAVRTIPSLAPGETSTQYFFVTYPQKDARGKSVTGAASNPLDDLWLNYDIWVTANGGYKADQTTKVTMRNEISAMANKVGPNTTAKVPTEYLTLFEKTLGWRPGVDSPRIPGALMTEGIWYDFGTVGAGFDNNGDGIPDRNAWMQPVGTPSTWNPLAARLVKCYGVVIVKLNNAPERVIPFEDRLYFENIPANNTGAVGFVYYEYLPLTPGAQVTVSPYQEVASGYDNEKFNGDFGAGSTVLPIPPASLSLTKTGTASAVAAGSTATFSMTATNTGTTPIGQPAYGAPFVIEDTIPEYANGVRYAFNTASATSTPASRSVEISYYNGSTWTTTAPADQTAANAITKIRWTLTGGGLDPSTSLTVQLGLAVPVGYSSKTLANTAIAKTGSVGQLASATDSTFVQGINSIGNLVWLDTNRDGVQDSGEAGIPGVKITLYFDANGNGVLDSTDPVYEVKDTDDTATNVATDGENYLFSNLPDGKYIAVVDYLDATLQAEPYTGAILKLGTSSAIKAINLDSAGTDLNPVVHDTADWPFILPLEVNKRVSPTAYDEGDLVTYYIDLENRAATVPSLAIPTQTSWASYSTSNSSDATYAAKIRGLPDMSYAKIDYKANADTYTLNPDSLADGWSFSSAQGTIKKVQLVFQAYLTQDLVDDRLEISMNPGITGVTPSTTTFYLYPTQQTPPVSTPLLNSLTGFTAKQLVVDLYQTHSTLGVVWTTGTATIGTSIITWNDIKKLKLGFKAAKTSNGDSGVLWVDAVGLRVEIEPPATSTGTFGEYTFLNLPLTDTYNASQLEYVTAVPAPTSTTPAGTLTWSNLGAINPGVRRTVEVTFRAKTPTSSPQVYLNTATSSGGTMASGITINTATKGANITVTKKGSISGRVWWDTDGDRFQDSDEVGLANVLVSLSNGARVYTDENGNYSFTGLDDSPVATPYIVTVHDRAFTDSANPENTTTNTLPFASPSPTPSTTTQTFEPDYPSTLDNKTSVAISGGGSVVNRDFGYDSTLNVISGSIFADNNGNAATTTTPEAGENYLANVVVALQRWNGSAWVAHASTTTDANGFYQFGSLSDGEYKIVVTTPLNTTQTLDPDGVLNGEHQVIVSGGNLYKDKDFAYRPSGTLILSGVLYRDWNNNNQQNTGETGIANVTINLYEDANGDGFIDPATDAFIATTTTDANGAYSFGSATNGYLIAGSYRVLVDTADPDFPTGVVQTQDYDGIRDNRASVTLVSTNITNVDFGYYPKGTGSIGDKVFVDGNTNGTEDSGEAGISGVTVSLYYDSNGDNVLDNDGLNNNDDVLVATKTTDASGNYLFPNLPAGRYFVKVGTLASPYNTYLATNSGTQTVNLTASQNYLTADFGFAVPATIGDTVYRDLNRNGTQDWSEPGISGVTVKLYAADANGAPTGAVLATTTTSSSGVYQFTGLAAGSYAVVVDTTTGGLSTLTNTGDPDRDGVSSDVTLYNYADPGNLNGLMPADSTDSKIILASGTTYTGGDFGYATSAYVVGDYVWFDLDKHGVQDAGELGIPNVTLTLHRASDNTTINVTTDADGKWNAVLTDGSWTVTVDGSNFSGGALVGRSNTWDADGGSANTTAFTLAGGSVTSPEGGNLGLDFGYGYTSGTLSLSGTVVTKDGGTLGTADDDIVDHGEIELAGQYVYLTDSTGKLLASTTTDSLGNYTFGGLIPSTTYYVTLSTTNPVLDNASLTTNTTNAAAINNGIVTNVTEYTASVRQTVVMPGAGAVTNVDFAFTPAQFDMGDLPSNYGITALAADGARHIAPSGGFTVRLGTYRDTEIDATESAGADGDDNTGSPDDEDGVTANFDSWQDGNGTGSVSVAVTGSGWLVGWVDFNNDGDFVDSGEMVISRAVTTGTTNITFNIPANTGIHLKSSVYARFRLFGTQPLYPSVSYVGLAEDGEVEDYKFTRTPNVSISGTVRRDYYNDGTQYTAIPGVTLTLQVWNGSAYVDIDSDAGTGGVQPTTATTDSNGYYSFANLPAGTYRVVQTQPTSYASKREEKEGVADGTVDNMVVGIVLTGTSPNVSTSSQNNFVEVLQGCPDTWAAWQDKWTLTDETLTGNPDGDRYNNLIEYAFCLPPNSGVYKPFCLEPSTTVSGGIDGVYHRTVGGATDVTYTLQYKASLTSGTWSSTNITVGTAGVTATYDPLTGAETVRIPNLESFTGLASGEGFVRMRVTLEAGVTDPTATTEVLGWTETSLRESCSSFNNPYLRCATFTGTVSSVNGQNLVFSGESFSSLLDPAESYYIEVTSGTYEGHRFDVSAASGTNITLVSDSDIHSATAPFNTRAGAPPSGTAPDTLVGATVVLRRHWRLGVQFPVSADASTGFAASGDVSNDPETADRVQVFANGAWSTYYVYDQDGSGATYSPKWVKLGDGTYADRDSVVLPPGQGLYVSRPNRTSPADSTIAMLSYGEVRENAFIRPLQAGNNLVGGGFPIDQSARGTGSRLMNLTPTLNGFFGSRDFKTADSFFIWQGDAAAGGEGYDTYYLLSRPNTLTLPQDNTVLKWVKVGDAALTSKDAEVLFLSDRAVFVRAKYALNTYTIPCPWVSDPTPP